MASPLHGGRATRATISYWLDEGREHGLVPDPSPPLAAPISADVLVIGGGFAGLSTALAIAEGEARRRVVLVDAEPIGVGPSGRNAGMLSPVPAPSWLLGGALPVDERRWALGELADRTRRIAATLAPLDGGAVPAPMYLCGSSRLARASLAWLHECLAAMGTATARLSAAEADSRVGERCRLAVTVPTWAIRPARLCWALRRLALDRGVVIHERTPIARIEPAPRAVAAFTAGGIRIDAQRVVVAAGAWSAQPPFGARGRVFQTYMTATPPLDASHLDALGDDRAALVGTLGRAFTYRRVVDGRLLFGGLDDPVKAPLPPGVVPDHVVPKLRRLLEARTPRLAGVTPDRVWGGAFHLAGGSDLPSLRTSPADPRVIVYSGSAGAGVVWCLLSGALVRGLVDPRLEDPADARLRAALQRSRVPVRQALGLTARLLWRALRP